MRVIRWVIVLLLISPFLILIEKSNGLEIPSYNELSQILSFTIWQAGLSALLSVGLGFLGALGLAGRVRFRKIIEAVLILPNLVPTLLIIISTMTFITRFTEFPFGLTGIVLLHGILNIGLVTVALARIFESRLGSLSEAAYVMGSGHLRFASVAFGYIKREVYLLFLFVFSISFTSFSIPLIVGGVSGSTIEVVIYHKIRSQGLWGEALFLSFLQMFFVFVLAMVVSKYKLLASTANRGLQLLKIPIFIIFPLICSFIVITGIIGPETVRGFFLIMKNELLVTEITSGVFYSSLVGGSVGALTTVFLLLIAYSTPHPFFQRFLLGYSVPSTAMTGFAILIVTDNWPIFRMILGILLISLPVIYRFLGDEALEKIKKQISVAKIMGASNYQIFKMIQLPQIIETAFFAGGIAAFWAVGDFALSSIVSGRDITLALLVKSLLTSYHMDMAVCLVWLLLIIGLSFYFIFGSLGRVFDRKLKA